MDIYKNIILLYICTNIKKNNIKHKEFLFIYKFFRVKKFISLNVSFDA